MRRVLPLQSMTEKKPSRNRMLDFRLIDGQRKNESGMGEKKAFPEPRIAGLRISNYY